MPSLVVWNTLVLPNYERTSTLKPAPENQTLAEWLIEHRLVDWNRIGQVRFDQVVRKWDNMRAFLGTKDNWAVASYVCHVVQLRRTLYTTLPSFSGCVLCNKQFGGHPYPLPPYTSWCFNWTTLSSRLPGNNNKYLGVYSATFNWNSLQKTLKYISLLQCLKDFNFFFLRLSVLSLL